MNAQTALEPPAPGILLGGEFKVLELIATGARLETILDALCRVIDEQSGRWSSIFLLDGADERLSLVRTLACLLHPPFLDEVSSARSSLSTRAS